MLKCAYAYSYVHKSTTRSSHFCIFPVIGCFSQNHRLTVFLSNSKHKSLYYSQSWWNFDSRHRHTEYIQNDMWLCQTFLTDENFMLWIKSTTLTIWYKWIGKKVKSTTLWLFSLFFANFKTKTVVPLSIYLSQLYKMWCGKQYAGN